MKLRTSLLSSALCLAIAGAIAATLPAAGAAPTTDFSLEVSPSPLVTTVKPGMSDPLELHVHNAGAKTEQLKIEARTFTVKDDSKSISLSDKPSSDLESWVKFSEPTFALQPDQWLTQHVTITLPDSAGFSYPFAIVISRQNEPTVTSGGNQVTGSIAVFTLVNVDKPGATRRLEMTDLGSARGIYEYLPATVNITLKNTGNTFVQPYGNVYIEPSGNHDQLAALPLNDERGYILPGTTRVLSASWNDGFPRFVTTTDKNGKTSTHTEWNWSDLSHLRIGRYTAKVVAVYNDGTRDVPVTGQISFWVIPWRILLILLAVLLVIGFGVWSIISRIFSTFSRRRSRRKET